MTDGRDDIDDSFDDDDFDGDEFEAPVGVPGSTVVVGAATTNGTPCARQASARP